MENVKKIVIPVDFMENTDKLIEYAMYIGEALGADLHIVHAVGVYNDVAMFGVPVFPDEQKETYLRKAREHMEDLLSKLKAKKPDIRGDVVVGDPMDEIVVFAEEKGADLIIISTHGAKGIEKILLGSVAQRVVKLAHCPVLVMNPFKK